MEFLAGFGFVSVFLFAGLGVSAVVMAIAGRHSWYGYLIGFASGNAAAAITNAVFQLTGVW